MTVASFSLAPGVIWWVSQDGVWKQLLLPSSATASANPSEEEPAP